MNVKGFIELHDHSVEMPYKVEGGDTNGEI